MALILRITKRSSAAVSALSKHTYRVCPRTEIGESNMTIPTISSVIEHLWTTEAGPRACIKLTYIGDNQIGWRCGYVETRLSLDAEPILADVSCHGGITWFNKVDEFAELAVGFDCAHAWGNSIESDTLKVFNGEVRGFNYCFEQCEKLAKQIVAIETDYNL